MPEQNAAPNSALHSKYLGPPPGQSLTDRDDRHVFSVGFPVSEKPDYGCSACSKTKARSSGDSKYEGVALWPSPGISLTLMLPPPAA